MGQTDAVTRRTFWMGGTPWQKNGPVDLLWAHSPIKDVAKVKTPTLFVAGALDARIPQQQAQEMHRALESNGIPTRLLIAANEGHQWSGLRSLFSKANTELEWLEQYVMNRRYQWEIAPAAPTTPR
jgi:dipeptidyl aminopeptidase/acylaminoacyl peptidase